MQVEGNVEGVTPRPVPSLSSVSWSSVTAPSHTRAAIPNPWFTRRGAFEVTSADGGVLLFSRLQVSDKHKHRMLFLSYARTVGTDNSTPCIPAGGSWAKPWRSGGRHQAARPGGGFSHQRRRVWRLRMK